jgi:hypothetical protein
MTIKNSDVTATAGIYEDMDGAAYKIHEFSVLTCRQEYFPFFFVMRTRNSRCCAGESTSLFVVLSVLVTRD